jgi:5'-methylthioadenosine phosphorylase
VSVETIIQIIKSNVAMAKNIIRHAVAEIVTERACPCAEALKYAIISDRSVIPRETRADLDLLIGKYLQG